MNAKEYAKQAGDLFVLPDTVLRIQELAGDETASILDIAEVVQYDPALSAQLLKIANSSVYNFEKTVETTSKAIQVMGIDAVYNLALAYAVSNTFKEIESSVIDLDKYWELSVCCALFAKTIAEQLGLKQGERLFVAGLLHNIGELAIVQLAPEKAKKCNNLSPEMLPVTLQLNTFGFAYAELSSELLRAWSVPVEISASVAKQHASVQRASNTDEQIIQLAISVALDNINSDVYPDFPHLQEELYLPLGLTRSDVENALEQANLQLFNVLTLFRPTSFSLY